MSPEILIPFNFLAEGVSHGAWWYVEQCDIFARFVICIILGCSLTSFSMIGMKLHELKALRNENLAFEQNLKDAKITTLRAVSQNRVPSAYGRIVNAAVNAYKGYEEKLENRRDVEICVRHVENAIERDIARLMPRYERFLVYLSTFVSLGPFLGLFGTVWGVIVTFGSLTEKATIAQLAPGVSGALLATLSGLFLAIPTLGFYNYLLTESKKRSTELENFASLIIDRVETELLVKIEKEATAKNNPPEVPIEEPILINTDVPTTEA